MGSFDTVLGLLYKRVSARSVIEDQIEYDRFSKQEFLNLTTVYVSQRSESEASNLYEYLISVCNKEALRRGFRGPHRDGRYLNVFELLLYVSRRYLDITNNTIRCKYRELPAWRRLTVELSEDLLVTAFLAQKLTYQSVMKRSFTWPRIIGHDNEHLHAVMKRGISENHSHLTGAAPIFHISWLSLMNHIANGEFAKRFHKYDRERRYTNVSYSGSYREDSFFHRYLQAVLIRLLLFSKMSGKLIKIGNYEMRFDEIMSYLRFSEYEKLSGGGVVFTKKAFENVEKKLQWMENCTYRELLQILSENSGSDEQRNTTEERTGSARWDFFVDRVSDRKRIDAGEACRLLEQYIGQPLYFIAKQLLRLIRSVPLDRMEEFFADHTVFVSIWERRTLMNVYEMVQMPYKIELEAGSLQSLIDGLQMEAQYAGAGLAGQIDYALGAFTGEYVNAENQNVVFAGERWLMYQMFASICLRKESIDSLYNNLFYAYLLIKESIRSEMIQSNLNVGFVNFQKYQDRKADFLANEVYNNIFTKLAAYDNLASANVRHTELRFTPQDTAEANLYLIDQFDKTLGTPEITDALVPGDACTTDMPVRERFFYTLHFAKKEEQIRSSLDYYYCRNYQRRERSVKIAQAIAEVRERYPGIGERIYGIDAASNEIGCRPEVFATAFRYLKSHRHIYRTCDGLKKLPQLRATYHVGEDFLDVADGLRAIDEAIKFLNLGYGDRIGHAIALGIDVKRWYEKKNYTIYLPEQDYLDNLTWVYQKLTEYGIQGFEHLKTWIYPQFTTIFQSLYGGQTGALRADIDNYYNAWKLRGDDPSLYESGRFEEKWMRYQRQPYLLNDQFPAEYDLRQLPEVSGLYYRYHFDERSRRIGAFRADHVMTKTYAAAVGAIQRAMQFDIASRGISIETNPSSNYHIGTFRSYEDHPIVHFFNKGLIHDEEKLRNCAQIPVSINTDDQGVFNTSLENEYALMAAALEAVTDDQDQKVYRPSDIYEWLDRIRIMGNDQNFAAMREKD